MKATYSLDNFHQITVTIPRFAADMRPSGAGNLVLRNRLLEPYA